MDLSQRELIDVGLDALEADHGELPAGLAQRVLDQASAARVHSTDDDAEWGTNARHPLTSLSAFITTAAELGHHLDTLSDDDWRTPTAVYDSNVRDLVAHLVGVERYVLGQLGRRTALDAPTRELHQPVTRGAAADLDGAPGPAVARAWWQEVMQVIAACSELGPSHPVTFHHLPGSIRGLLVVRTFEVWTHDDDIRRAVDRPVNDLDDPRLAMMSSTLMELIPQGMGILDTARPGRTARFVLTGDGAGTHDVALAPDQGPGDPDITITTSTVELCRLAAARVAIDDLPVEVDGDRSLLEPILVGAGAFALD
jgi:uncharacterized protein (TIGR03083 family)